MAILFDLKLLFTQDAFSLLIWVGEQRVIPFTELLTLVINHKLVLELGHHSVELLFV